MREPEAEGTAMFAWCGKNGEKPAVERLEYLTQRDGYTIGQHAVPFNGLTD
jgi:hypothetical protein